MRGRQEYRLGELYIWLAMSTKPKDDPERGSRWRTRIVPWSWLVLEVVATIAWLLAIVWGSLHVVSWFS